MIKFKRNNTLIEVEIEHGIFYNDDFYNLEIRCSGEIEAELLKRQLQKNLDKHLSKIYAHAYNEGWKNAKAKSKKRTDFYGCFIK